MGGKKGSWGYYRRNNSWRPPQFHGNISNLSIEKEFIQYLDSISWKRLCDAQKFRIVNKSIDKWDDSEALESFRSARSRFEALNHRSEIATPPLPNPDMYIDEIDHDLVIDPKIIADLERALEPVQSTDPVRARYGTNGWDSIEIVQNEKREPLSGWESWGDTEGKEKQNENNSTNWDRYVDKKENNSMNWDRFIEKNENNSPLWGNKHIGWGNNNKASCSSAWDKKDDSAWNSGNKRSLAWDKWECNNAWDNFGNKENKRIRWSNNGSASSSWETEDYCYNRGWNNNSLNRRNVRKGDRNGGFRVRKVRFNGEQCNSNWRRSNWR